MFQHSVHLLWGTEEPAGAQEGQGYIGFLCWNHNLIFCCDFAGEPKLLYKAELSRAWPFFSSFHSCELFLDRSSPVLVTRAAVNLGVLSFVC